MEIQSFSDFCAELHKCGFSLAGKDKGIYSLLKYDWSDQPENGVLRWHTGDPDTDPWEWRMRVIYERDDIAYAKLFFGTGGYVTKDWYSCFLSVRRHGESFDEAYAGGTMSAMSSRLYGIVAECGEIAMHDLKRLAGITKDDASRYERALTELQTRMFITMCGQVQKKNSLGLSYGWNSTIFTTVESFWQKRGFKPKEYNAQEAFEAISEQIIKLNPTAEKRRIERFIKG